MMKLTPFVALIAVIGAALAPSRVAGIYMIPETRAVPVARLVANLERQLEAGPPTADLHIRLARLYGMAYALNADEVPVAANRVDQDPGPQKGNEEVWLGPDPQLIPHRLKPEATRTASSRKYLQQALSHYREALALDPASLLARLGHGWALEQSGNKSAAIAEYRQVVEHAWLKEQSRKFARMGQRFYTEEAAGYLIPLLDPIKDDAEITVLRDRAKYLTRLPRPVTPLAIPLVDGTTAATVVDLEARVPFDADGSGQRRRWTWISERAAWLVYDPAGAGQIASALQWFGSVTFWLFWNNGYEALAVLDDDHDGELADRELRHLRLWVDDNRNGRSEQGEVRRLSDHGIAGVSCRYVAGDNLLVAATSPAGVRLADGRVRPTYDVMLRPASALTGP